jgi:hypothetical protein
LLTACSIHYAKLGDPALTRQDFDRDYRACFEETAVSLWVAVPAALFCTPCLAVMVQQKKNRTHDCMVARGYTVGGNSGFKQYE